MKNHKKLKFVFLVILILLIILFANFTDFRLLLDRESVKAMVGSYGTLGFVIFIGIYVLSTILFLPGTPLTLSSGYLFGPVTGTLIVIIGATLGASGAYFISKLLGKNFVDRILHQKFKKLDEYDSKLEKSGFIVTLFLRLIPLFPFNGLNFALGLTRVKFRDFFLATLIGIIPGTFVLVNLGANATEVRSFRFYLFIALFILLALSPRIYKLIKPKITKYL